MKDGKRDLVIHYDEENQKIIFYATDVVNTKDIRANEFDGVCPEVEHFKSLDPDSAEQSIGAMIFALLDLHSSNKIGIRAYETEAEENSKLWAEELEEQVKTNDPEAQYNLFIYLHNQAMQNCSHVDLARAESLLIASASQGYKDAQASLQNWATLKDAAERRINRGN